MLYFLGILFIFLGALMIKVPEPDAGPGCQGWLQGSGIVTPDWLMVTLAVIILIVLTRLLWVITSGFVRIILIAFFSGVLGYVLITSGASVFFALLAFYGLNLIGLGICRTIFNNE